MKFTLLIFAFLSGVSLTHAQVVITEIMYDLEGSDTGREWVEVQNVSAQAIDFSLWRFFEGETNHKIEVVQGDAIISPGSYAVLADNSEKFKADWPQFSGTIFNSSFYSEPFIRTN